MSQQLLDRPSTGSCKTKTSDFEKRLGLRKCVSLGCIRLTSSAPASPALSNPPELNNDPTLRFGPTRETIDAGVHEAFKLCTEQLSSYSGLFGVFMVGRYERDLGFEVYGSTFQGNIVLIVAENPSDTQSLIDVGSLSKYVLVTVGKISLAAGHEQMRGVTDTPSVGHSVGLLGQSVGSATLCCYLSTPDGKCLLTVGHLARGVDSTDLHVTAPSAEDLEAQIAAISKEFMFAKEWAQELDLKSKDRAFWLDRASCLQAEVADLKRSKSTRKTTIGPCVYSTCTSLEDKMQDYAIFKCPEDRWSTNVLLGEQARLSKTPADCRTTTEGSAVYKIGRTTGKSAGRSLNHSGVVNLGIVRHQIKSHQAIFGTNEFGPGDSGALLYSITETAGAKEATPIGMIYAMVSTLGGEIALYQPLSDVLDGLSVALGFKVAIN